jgi:hypothetical protein
VQVRLVSFVQFITLENLIMSISKIAFTVVSAVSIAVASAIPASASQVGSAEWECENFGINCQTNNTSSVESVITANAQVGSAEWECENFNLNCK